MKIKLSKNVKAYLDEMVIDNQPRTVSGKDISRDDIIELALTLMYVDTYILKDRK